MPAAAASSRARGTVAARVAPRAAHPPAVRSSMQSPSDVPAPPRQHAVSLRGARDAFPTPAVAATQRRSRRRHRDWRLLEAICDCGCFLTPLPQSPSALPAAASASAAFAPAYLALQRAARSTERRRTPASPSKASSRRAWRKHACNFSADYTRQLHVPIRKGVCHTCITNMAKKRFRLISRIDHAS